MDNTEQKNEIMQAIFEDLLKFINKDYQDMDLHQVEENIFRQLLKLGKSALEQFIEIKGTGKDKYSGILPYHKLENWKYQSVFGPINIKRAYFRDKENKRGVCPIDKELNLPTDHFSYLLKKWEQMLVVDKSYDKARKDLSEILGVNIWSLQAEQHTKKGSITVDDFYDSINYEEAKQPILCVEIDCKGIPIKDYNPDSNNKRIDLKKETKHRKKMSCVTSVFEIDRNIRTANDILEKEANKNKKIEIKPRNKLVKATLDDKEIAFKKLQKDVSKKDPNNKCEHIALMDGEKKLETLSKEYLADFTIIIDIVHVIEKIWEISEFYYQRKDKRAQDFVKKNLRLLLEGKIDQFISENNVAKNNGNLSEVECNELEKIINYFEARKQYMNYNEYLEKGFPIATGVIEGACRSFVKDRMESSGMRWTIECAESMLKLKSIKTNGYWNDYWEYYPEKEKERLYSNNKYDIFKRLA
jgi:hypothetical protein